MAASPRPCDPAACDCAVCVRTKCSHIAGQPLPQQRNSLQPARARRVRNSGGRLQRLSARMQQGKQMR